MPENLFTQIWFIAAIALVTLLYFPVAFMRHRMKKMSESDLKKIDRLEWVKQVKSNAYSKLIGRGFLGLVLFGLIVFNYKLIAENGIDFSVCLTFLTGAIFIFSAFAGYKGEMKKLQILDRKLC